MLLGLLLPILLISGGVSFAIARLFDRSISRILGRLVSDELSDAGGDT